MICATCKNEVDEVTICKICGDDTCDCCGFGDLCGDCAGNES